MRARRLRPVFDSLDTRLVLSASSATLVGVPPASAVVTSAGTTPSQTASSAIDWYLPGTPPLESGDPTQMPIPWDQMTTQ